MFTSSIGVQLFVNEQMARHSVVFISYDISRHGRWRGRRQVTDAVVCVMTVNENKAKLFKNSKIYFYFYVLLYEFFYVEIIYLYIKIKNEVFINIFKYKMAIICSFKLIFSKETYINGHVLIESEISIFLIMAENI